MQPETLSESPGGRHHTMRFLRTLLVFVTVAVAGMALLPEALAYVNAGKDPVTAYAPFPTVTMTVAAAFTYVQPRGSSPTCDICAC